MKRIVILLLSFILTLTLVGCINESISTTTKDEKTTTSTLNGDTTTREQDTTTSNDDVTTIVDNNTTTTIDNQTTTTKENITTTTNDDVTTTTSNTDDGGGDNDQDEVTLDETKFTIKYESGTENAYTISGNTITFSNITEASVYSITGEINGNIVIDVSDDYKFELDFNGVTINSSDNPPVVVESGDKVEFSFKKDTVNYINDLRDEVADEDGINSAIYANCDLSIKGKGTLNLVSTNNKGVHTKDDLEIKNLTLNVECMDNALKGNDSVTIESGTLTLISKKGDGIKTSNSDISSKGNQRGTITITGGNITIYAACDGIDAAYDVVINEDNATVNLNVFTDKYSSYSLEVTDVAESFYYIRSTTNSSYYSIKYFNSDTDYVFKNATYYTSKEGMSGRNRVTYYYYKVDKPANYSKLNVYVYDSESNLGQDQTYKVSSGSQTVNDSYDTIGYSGTRFSWTNYQTTSGSGSMQEGNPDKGDYSTKGIKADNEILISSGTINIKSYDDGIHANNDNELENNEAPTGNITISGGKITIYSNDDGIHADGTLTISGGDINVTNSYEGIEGTYIVISGGKTSVISSDDGVNAKTTTGEGIKILDGYLFVYAGGDGLDSNSKSSYDGILFAGGTTIIMSTSSGNSSIDSEQGYKYTGGKVLALCPSGGMSNEATKASNFSSVATKSTMSLTKDAILSVNVGGETEVALKVPKALNALVIYLGSNSASFSTSSSTSLELDSNGVYIK
ncbi:MAG: carbohydrate-binding domain-containing protein [Bacilli bacterium]|nr:carbohydrate-binding domain-containing protein [Bacilli bacterium]